MSDAAASRTEQRLDVGSKTWARPDTRPAAIRPDDIRRDMLWYRNEVPDGFSVVGEPNPGRHWPPCRVYWGSHGCSRPHGHDGAHWCDCCDCAAHPDHDSGCVAGPPYYGPDTKFFGEDVVA